LFYRLHIVPVRLPPLRERPADIEAPALHFVAQLSRMRIASPIKSEPPSSSEYPAT
jgi:transcriptional regulator with GAF, ATPase, and Fis domain